MNPDEDPEDGRVVLDRIVIEHYLDSEGRERWGVDFDSVRDDDRGVSFLVGMGMLEAAKMDLTRQCYPIVADDE